MNAKDWLQVWAAVEELWPPDVSIARIGNAAHGYEWMAFETSGVNHDLLGAVQAHAATLPELLKALGGEDK